LGRQRPTQVTVNGNARSDFSAEGIRLDRPFQQLTARW
jgi:hypothetical protein